MAKKKRKLTAWQRHVKSYMATHKGLSFKEALPKAKLTYRKGRGSSPSSSPHPRASSKPGKVKRKMPKKKKKRRSGGMTIPLAVVAPIALGVGEPVMWGLVDGMPWDEVLRHLAWRYSGYSAWSGKFEIRGLERGILPLIMGLLVHKFVGGAPLNLNRILARAKVPFVRI